MVDGGGRLSEILQPRGKGRTYFCADGSVAQTTQNRWIPLRNRKGGGRDLGEKGQARESFNS